MKKILLRRILLALFLLTCAAGFFIWLDWRQPEPANPPPANSTTTVVKPTRSGPAISHSHTAAGKTGAVLYPDPTLTPGIVDPSQTKEMLCTAGHTTETRHVTESMKEQVFRRYGISDDQRYLPNGKPRYEIDHFIPLILGGANVIENLWPEPWEEDGANTDDADELGAHAKDHVEVFLRDEVCKRGTKELAEAASLIQSDWYAVYLEWKARPHRKKRPV